MASSGPVDNSRPAVPARRLPETHPSPRDRANRRRSSRSKPASRRRREPTERLARTSTRPNAAIPGSGCAGNDCQSTIVVRRIQANLGPSSFPLASIATGRRRRAGRLAHRRDRRPLLAADRRLLQTSCQYDADADSTNNAGFSEEGPRRLQPEAPHFASLRAEGRPTIGGTENRPRKSPSAADLWRRASSARVAPPESSLRRRRIPWWRRTLLGRSEFDSIAIAEVPGNVPIGNVSSKDSGAERGVSESPFRVGRIRNRSVGASARNRDVDQLEPCRSDR